MSKHMSLFLQPINGTRNGEHAPHVQVIGLKKHKGDNHLVRWLVLVLSVFVSLLLNYCY